MELFNGKGAIAVYRKEDFYLLADVEDTEDPATRSGRRAVFPRPEMEEDLQDIFTSAVVFSSLY